MKSIRIFTATIGLLFLVSTASAVEVYQIKSYPSKVEQAKEPQPQIASPDFVPYETNSVVWQGSHRDKPALNVNYSFRYYVSRDHSQSDAVGLGWFLSYIGEFDFYWLSVRPSSPVVNRTSNPAFHWRSGYDFLPESVPWLDLALEHISNGQTLEAKPNKNIIQTAIDNNDQSTLDSISRANTQIALTGEVLFNLSHKDQLFIKGILRGNQQDGAIYWGEYANTNTNFNDYQLAIFTYRHIFNPDTKDLNGGNLVQFKFNVGHKFQKGTSLDFLGRYYWKIDTTDFSSKHHFPLFKFNLPIAITAHLGPMKTMSNYTQRQSSIGIGLCFDY